LLHELDVVVIDEPIVGLDPQHARVVKDIVKERAKAEMTVLVSSYHLRRLTWPQDGSKTFSWR
jgi:ABC-2 type transport system ATP-binding protein